jgi:D-aminopeptidase
MRARELGIEIGVGEPGPQNGITDVGGVTVGHTTLIDGEGDLRVGVGPIRTGVTVLVPRDQVWAQPVFAGWHRLNGNGELTGTTWIRESGLLTTPVALTNTHSVGTVRDALVAAIARERSAREVFWALPVVGETWDGLLNDINGQHVKPEHVEHALASATAGAVPEGNVGGGTGMICHGFKGGIGTASRVLPEERGGFTVGALVQANHGRRKHLTVAGIPAGRLIAEDKIPAPGPAAPADEARGSIIVLVATDAPLLPHQCERLAQRAGLGVARAGGVGEHWSGDLFLAFATGNRDIPASDHRSAPPLLASVRMLADAYLSELFDAVVEATEEAIVNALLSAETMTGRDGIVARALEPELLVDALERYRWSPRH